MDSAITTAGAGGGGNYLSAEKDAKESSTAPKFGEIFQKIQTQYGAKPEKPREIKKTLGKDDFLRIMITQMRHQDPTNPFKAEQMATEMAQFTSVEQLQNLNQGMAKLSTANQPLERMAMTGMIGKVVTVDRARFPHAEGQAEPISYQLPSNAKEVRVALISDKGETILEKSLGAQKAGENTFNWDGLKGNTLPAKSGEYMMKMEAVDEKDRPMRLDSRKQARVIGVSFEGQEPIFLIGDAKNQEKVSLKNIVRIDTDGTQQPLTAPGVAAPATPSVAAQAGPQSSNFFGFRKGVGSANLDAAQSSPEVAEALAQYEARRQAEADGDKKQADLQAAMGRPASATPQTSPAANERGFPNGLSDPEQQGGGLAAATEASELK